MENNNEITDFNETERGTDLSFCNLGQMTQAKVKQIADECFTAVNPKAAFVRSLDSSEEFRDLIGCRDHNIYPQEVDCCVRWFEWELKSREKTI